MIYFRAKFMTYLIIMMVLKTNNVWFKIVVLRGKLGYHNKLIGYVIIVFLTLPFNLFLCS